MLKTYKLYINGAFVRSESGATFTAENPSGKVLAHVASASRKDFRDAVETAHAAQERWADASAYLRGQILYRMAEMMDGRREEFADAIDATRTPSRATARREVDAAIDRLVCFAGWTDKYGHILGCHDPVSGPYYTFTIPEAVGTVVVFPPDEPSLLGLVTLVAAPLCAGCATVVITNETHPLPAAIFGEICATSDVPAGVVSILTAKRKSLVDHVALHRNVDAVCAAGVTRKQAIILRAGAAENLKRVHVLDFDDEDWTEPDIACGPDILRQFLEMKTIWHPAAT